MIIDTDKKEIDNDARIEYMRALINAGYAVVMWSPEELGTTDSGHLESYVIEKGNDFIEDDHAHAPDWDRDFRETVEKMQAKERTE